MEGSNSRFTTFMAVVLIIFIDQSIHSAANGDAGIAVGVQPDLPVGGEAAAALQASAGFSRVSPGFDRRGRGEPAFIPGREGGLSSFAKPLPCRSGLLPACRHKQPGYWGQLR